MTTASSLLLFVDAGALRQAASARNRRDELVSQTQLLANDKGHRGEKHASFSPIAGLQGGPARAALI